MPIATTTTTIAKYHWMGLSGGQRLVLVGLAAALVAVALVARPVGHRRSRAVVAWLCWSGVSMALLRTVMEGVVFLAVSAVAVVTIAFVLWWFDFRTPPDRERGIPSPPDGPHDPEGGAPMTDDAKKIYDLRSKDNKGVIAGEYHNHAPKPDVRAGRQLAFNEQDANGDYHARYELLVTNPHAAGNLTVSATAPSIKSVKVRPQRTGAFMTGASGVKGDTGFDNLQTLHDICTLEIVSGQPLTPPIRVDFDIA